MLINSPASKFRRDIDLEQYYTPAEKAKELYDATLLIVNSFADINDFDNFIEPSAGRGAFLYCMPKNKRMGLDIEYNGSHPEIKQQDFFDFVWPKGSTITIGNPPFGFKGKLAMRFLNISSENSDVVAMVLPAVFSKFTYYNKVHPFMHLMYETNVDEFIINEDETHPVKCVFQIWKKSDVKREKIVRASTCEYFTLTHRHWSRTPPEELEKLRQESTLGIKQAGGRVLSPGEITKGSIWWAKGGDVELFKRMDFSHLRKYHLGVLSLTKADIVEAYLIEYNKDK